MIGSRDDLTSSREGLKPTSRVAIPEEASTSSAVNSPAVDDDVNVAVVEEEDAKESEDEKEEVDDEAKDEDSKKHDNEDAGHSKHTEGMLTARTMMMMMRGTRLMPRLRTMSMMTGSRVHCPRPALRCPGSCSAPAVWWRHPSTVPPSPPPWTPARLPPAS